MKSRAFLIFIHLIFWTCSLWLIASSFSIQSYEVELINGQESVKIVRDRGLIYQILICGTIAALMFYSNVFLVIRQQSNKPRTIVFSIATLVISLCLVFPISQLKVLDFGPSLPIQISFGIVIFYFTVSTAYALARLSLAQEKKQQQLILDKKQAELNLLRNQLQPHFLFNALNNLLSMVKPDENPELANSFEQLSQLLRYVIEETGNQQVTVNKEIEFLKNYIELQLLRFTDQEVQVDFKVIGNYLNQAIEPGLFIGFVENAFKYGTEPEKETRIDLSFDLTRENRVLFHIKNDTLMPHQHGTKTGIDNIKKRLSLIYPEKHKLVITAGEEFFVQLNIQTR